ncbi:MAG: hypothetical protein M1834_009347 [Cirrosporium novae-zelandiae]|nr:MAG: hypothetical protein M1834_009347 [Cirrosporium novae-zelandiae]
MSHLDTDSLGHRPKLSPTSYSLLDAFQNDSKAGADQVSETTKDDIRINSWTQKPKSLPSIKKKILGCLIDLVLVLFCLILFAFAIFGYRADNKTLGDNEILLLKISNITTTGFPYIFAVILGRTLNSALKWRLENGVNALSFAYLGRCTTLGSTYLTPLQLRSLHWLPLILCILWAFSPLGSQASLRFISSQQRNIPVMSLVSYIYPNATDDLACADCVVTVDAANTVFFASLLTSDTDRTLGQDSWGNIKIPAIEEINKLSGEDGWINLAAEKANYYTSLIGIPFTKPSESFNSIFELETWYWWTSPHHMTPIESGMAMTNYSNMSGYLTFVGLNKIWQLVIPASDWTNGSIPLILEQINIGADGVGTKLEMSLSPILVEMKVECGPSACSPLAVRNSTLPRPSSSSSNLKFLQLYLLNDFVEAFPLTHDGTPYPSALELYLMNGSNAAILSDADEQVDLGSVGAEKVAFRLSQILNTYWMAASFSSAVVGAPQNNIENYTLNTTAIVQNPEKYLHTDLRWLAILCIAITVMFCATLLSGTFAFLSIGPDATDYLSAWTRSHQAISLPGGSYLDAEERIRLLKDVELQIGDSRPEEEVGNIVIGPVQSVSRLETGRLYK